MTQKTWYGKFSFGHVNPNQFTDVHRSRCVWRIQAALQTARFYKLGI